MPSFFRRKASTAKTNPQTPVSAIDQEHVNAYISRIDLAIADPDSFLKSEDLGTTLQGIKYLLLGLVNRHRQEDQEKLLPYTTANLRNVVDNFRYTANKGYDSPGRASALLQDQRRHLQNFAATETDTRIEAETDATRQEIKELADQAYDLADEHPYSAYYILSDFVLSICASEKEPSRSASRSSQRSNKQVSFQTNTPPRTQTPEPIEQVTPRAPPPAAIASPQPIKPIKPPVLQPDRTSSEIAQDWFDTLTQRQQDNIEKDYARELHDSASPRTLKLWYETVRDRRFKDPLA